MPYLGRFPAALFELVFPEDCRVCSRPLREVSRVPVCAACLAEPAPFEAEFFCRACRTPFLNGAPLDEQGLCGVCRLGLANFDAAYSYGAYQGTLRKLIHLFKYDGIRTLAEPLGRYLALALPPGEQFDGVVPMPLHWRKRWQRGFNQSALLARVLARRTSVPVIEAVRRVKATRPQAGLTNAQRRGNVAAAFRIRDPKSIEGRRLLLIDDVLTTGATVRSCAKVLKRAGARRVTVLTIARADRRPSAGEPVFHIQESPR